MTTWQRRLRIGLGVFILLFAGVVYLAVRKQPPPPPQPPRQVAPLDPKAQLQAQRGTYKGFKGGKLDFTIDYEAIVEYTGAATKIRGVKADFPDRNGRDCQVAGDEALVAPDQSSFEIHGHVRFASSDGLVLTMDEASYTQAEDIVRSPGRVEFTRGTMRGSGVGMTYDQRRDVLSFADQFEMTDPGQEGQPPSEAHAATGVWDRTQQQMRLERESKIVRGSQTLEADVATLYLTPDGQHLQSVQLQGNSRITNTPAATPGSEGPQGQGSEGQASRPPDLRPSKTSGRPEPVDGRTAGPPEGSGSSALRAMRARDINLSYAEDGETLKQAVLAGDGSVEVVSAGNDAPTRIAGEFIDFSLESDGATMRSLSARGANPASPARLDLPAQGSTPRRVIRATTIQGPTPGKAKPAPGLTTMRFADNVVYNEAPAPPGQLRTATARVLEVVMQPGFGAIDEARFSGNARLQEGTSLEASARDARYDVKAGSFEFTGTDDSGGPPFVKDQDQAAIRAARILVRPDGHKVSASGSVQTTMQPAKKRSDGTTGRTPGLLSQDKPALAASDDLQYDGAASQAIFTSSKGRSKLWQDQGNSIYGAEIRVDDAKGDLAAKGNVSTLMKLDQTDTKTKRKEQVPTTITADDLVYQDAARKATYTGHVQLKGGAQGNMKANRAALFLTADGTALDHLEAWERVELEDEGTPTGGRRTTTGDRLSYTAADEHYVVTGQLVQVCEERTGASEGRKLEFWRSIDKMIIDGNAERRTQTKGGQGCKK